MPKIIYPKFANLEHAFIVTRWIYGCLMNGNGDDEIEPPMTDSQYQHVERYLKSQNLLPEYTSRTWSEDPCPVDLLIRYGLNQFIYNLVLTGKTESIPSITDESEVERFYKNCKGTYLVSFKIDGWNLQLTYYNKRITHIQTRGREMDAIDMTHLRKVVPQKISYMGEVKIVCEMCLHNNDFKKLQEMYPEKELISQRACVRTAVANEEANHLLSFLAFNIITDDPEVNAKLTATMKYGMLKAWGFKTPDYKVVTDGYDGIIAAIREFSDRRGTYPYLTDGIVVRTDSGEELRAIRIMAWSEAIHKSYITGYEYTEGPLNESVKLLIRPVLLENSRHQRICITNEARIKKYKLFVGTPIAFKLTSAVSPQPDLDITALLQKEYANDLEGYRDLIDANEEAKLVISFGDSNEEALLANGTIQDAMDEYGEM